MILKVLLVGSFVCASVTALAATPLTESTFTEIIKEATVVTASTGNATPARTNEVFKVPDLVRTGTDSRLEMTAPDETITRVGANTVFTFEAGERNIRLEKGSILFHSPAGAGGGTIKYRGTTAAVLGTTMICAVLSDGSFKVLVLEGHGKVTLANLTSVTLEAGQMIIVPPVGDAFSPVMTFSLARLVPRLMLVVGFSKPLSSMSLITAAIQLQDEQIAAGKAGPLTPVPEAGKGLDLVPRTIVSDFPPTTDQTILFISPN
jgi:FecR protein